MDEVIALKPIETRIGAYIDIPLTVGTELPQDQILPVSQVMAQLLAVVGEQTLRRGDHPQTTVLILQQRIHGM